MALKTGVMMPKKLIYS